MTSLSLQSMIMLTSSCKVWLPDSSESAFDIVGGGSVFQLALKL